MENIDSLDFTEIFKNQNVSEEFVQKYIDYYYFVPDPRKQIEEMYHPDSVEQYIAEHIEYHSYNLVDWELLVQTKKLSDNLIKKYHKELCKYTTYNINVLKGEILIPDQKEYSIRKNRLMTKEEINKKMSEASLVDIFRYQKFSPDFISKFIKKNNIVNKKVLDTINKYQWLDEWPCQKGFLEYIPELTIYANCISWNKIDSRYYWYDPRITELYNKFESAYRKVFDHVHIYRSIPYSFLDNFKDVVYWCYIAAHYDINEEFSIRYGDKFERDYAREYQKKIIPKGKVNEWRNKYLESIQQQSLIAL